MSKHKSKTVSFSPDLTEVKTMTPREVHTGPYTYVKFANGVLQVYPKALNQEADLLWIQRFPSESPHLNELLKQHKAVIYGQNWDNSAIILVPHLPYGKFRFKDGLGTYTAWRNFYDPEDELLFNPNDRDAFNPYRIWLSSTEFEAWCQSLLDATKHCKEAIANSEFNPTKGKP